MESSCLDPDYLFPVCEEYKLTSAYIYLSIATQNYIKPLNFLYDILIKEDDSQKKRFFAYKLLWYFRLCLKGEKYPKGFIPTDQWHKVIINVFSLLVSGEILETLVKIDANSTLRVIWIAFQDLTPSQVLEHSKSPSLSDIINKLLIGE